MKKTFTLLEVLLVTLILGLMASTALLVVDSSDDQLRHEENADRLQSIRYALVGNASLQLNNQPLISVIRGWDPPLVSCCMLFVAGHARCSERPQ